jgi:hypothetical protein
MMVIFILDCPRVSLRRIGSLDEAAGVDGQKGTVGHESRVPTVKSCVFKIVGELLQGVTVYGLYGSFSPGLPYMGTSPVSRL